MYVCVGSQKKVWVDVKKKELFVTVVFGGWLYGKIFSFYLNFLQ